MNTLRYLHRQSWTLFWSASVLSIVSGLSGAAVVATVGKAINGSDDYLRLGLTFLSLCLLHFLSTALAGIAVLRSTQNAVFHMRVGISRKVLATPMKTLQALGKPGLLTILTGDIYTFVAGFAMIPAALSNCTIVLACLAYIAWLSWQVFLIFASLMVLFLAAYVFAERFPKRHMQTLRESMGTLNKHFRSLAEGSRELQLNAVRGQAFVDEAITSAAHRLRRSYTTGMSQYMWVLNIGVLMMYSVIGVLMFVIPAVLPQPAGVLSSSTLAIVFLMHPIKELMSIIPALRQANIALEKIQVLEGSLHAAAPPANPSNPFARAAPLELTLHGVCHRYPGPKDDSEFMLGPLDLTIRQGEICFIVGGNGCGKSTLAMLLLGLYFPEAGAVVLNGQAVDQDNIDAYRAHFSAVFADFYLFEELLGSAGQALNDRATHYLAKFGMAHKVQVHDGKFSTIDLSTGQRKRLALVSAYLEDRAVYLFDEWAADQDPAFKHIFYTEILPDLKARGKAVIVITHDDSYFTCADVIVKLQNGNVVSALAAAPAVALVS